MIEVTREKPTYWETDAAPAESPAAAAIDGRVAPAPPTEG